MLPPKLTLDDALHGEITHKVAKQLSKAVVPEQAADLERGASWLLLHDTGPRVRSGCLGWLFLTDELRINRHAQSNAQTKAGAVREIQQRLAKRGITLLVAVPDKSRIASSQLCDLRRPLQLQQRAVEWVDGLNKAGVAAIDLAPTLQPWAPMPICAPTPTGAKPVRRRRPRLWRNMRASWHQRDPRKD